MTALELISMARTRLNDTDKVTYQDAELLDYLNDAINKISVDLIATRDPQMVTEASLSVGDDRPADFYSFIGPQEVYFSGDKVAALSGAATGSFTVRYFAVKSRLTATSDDVPFGDWSIPSLVSEVVASALVRNGFNNNHEQNSANEARKAAVITKRSGLRPAATNPGGGQ